MKLLQKILFVVIIGLIVGNVDVKGMIQPEHVPPALPALVHGDPILDFDSIAAGNVHGALQPKLYDNPIAGAPNKRCVYFSIFQPGEVEDGNFVHAVARNPHINDNNIYFPTDGTQPTTPEAVQYSCANIDNRENSPITDWYMKMFGVIPINHAAIVAAGGIGVPVPIYVHAGWNAAATVAQAIMTFPAGFNGTDIIKDPDSGDLVSREDFFVQNFRRIASTSVGRVLLYRILIEIRRHNTGGNVGCLENIIPPHGALLIRNRLRSISINWDNGQFYFDWTLGEIGINNITTSLSSVGKEGSTAAGSYDSIINHKLPVDVSLFHEMNHWLHYLKYPDRYENEFNCYQPELWIKR